MRHVYKETTKEVYREILKAHFDDFSVYSSYTNYDGNDGLTSMPQVMTVWGFKDGNLGFLKAVSTKENREQREFDHKYYILSKVIEEE